MLQAITQKISDVLDIFYGRKNVHLGVNGNPAGKSGEEMSEWDFPRRFKLIYFIYFYIVESKCGRLTTVSKQCRTREVSIKGIMSCRKIQNKAGEKEAYEEKEKEAR